MAPSADSLSSFFSSSPTTEHVDTKIQSFQRRILQLQDGIRRLEEYRNTQLLVVSKLPPEVLSIIFEHLALGQPPVLPGYAWILLNNVLPVTQVCRHWRQVALDSPRIWGCIPSSAPPRLVELFLRRVKSAPLYLRTNTYFRPANMVIFLDHLSQMKEIDLHTVDPEWLKRITSEPTPLLETLALESTSAKSFTFSAGAFPALRRLSLKRYVCKTSLASLTSLRSLVIDSTYTSTPELPSPIEFFTALNDFPHLSSLTLVNALAQPMAPTSSLSICLPSLRHLSIEDGEIRNIGLITCITAPCLETIKLWTTRMQLDVESSLAVIVAIYSKLPDLTHSSCEFILSTRRSSSYARVRVWANRTEDWRDSTTPFFDFKVIGPIAELQIEESVLMLFPPTSVPPTLYFSSDAHSFSDDFFNIPRWRILRQLTNVTEVHADRLIDLVLIMCDTPTKRGQNIMSLPSWTKMVLHDVFDIDYKAQVLARLKKQADARKANNAAIKTWQFNLRTTGTTALTSADVQQFEDLVDAVEIGSRQCHQFLL
ncbi:hypothetical protein CCMSSC00406_0007784 [Pleurotus cornucopiae]|uniref:Uncharacterized protein n=1 Tax=Pleurotus cornucopiae TaxID=5321 RepID=A0ACB7J7I4_PLECO|nr:hypothetical protein CCMSSC00406_0007784 [Pleurotus cornucopiae]